MEREAVVFGVFVGLLLGIVLGLIIGASTENSTWETKLLEKGIGEYRVENGSVKFRLKDD